MPQRRALLTWWYLSWYGLRASLEQLPTKCTRDLAHLSVVGRTSFQNTVSFPLSFGEPCLMLPIFSSLFACGGGFASKLLKCSSCSPSISLVSFFSQSSLALENCKACTRLSLRYFKRAQHSPNTRFSNAFLFSLQCHTIWYVYIFQISFIVFWSSYKASEKAVLVFYACSVRDTWAELY